MEPTTRRPGDPAVAHRVDFTVDSDGVGTLTLDRPDKRNAMDQAMFAGLHDAASVARAAVAEGSCHAVLVRGAGRCFSAGTDLAELADGAARPVEDDHLRWLQEAFTAWEDLDAPVVAFVHGVALGAGCQFALAADLRLVTPDAVLALPETGLGIVPDLGATVRLPALVGRSRAIDMVVRGRRVDAATALAWGLADELVEGVEGADPVAAARDLVAGIAARPPAATAAAARLVRGAAGRSRTGALADERAAQRTLLSAPGFREAFGQRVPAPGVDVD